MRSMSKCVSRTMSDFDTIDLKNMTFLDLKLLKIVLSVSLVHAYKIDK